MKLIDSETGYIYKDDITWEEAIKLSSEMGSMVKKTDDRVYVRVYRRHNKFPEKVRHIVYHKSGMTEGNKMKNIKISTEVLRQIIKEISQEHIAEVDSSKLRMMYNDAVRAIDKMNPQTSPKEAQEILDMVLSVGSANLMLGEKLLAMFNDKKSDVEKAWSHVGLRTPIAKRREMPMVTMRRPRRESVKISIDQLKEIISEAMGCCGVCGRKDCKCDPVSCPMCRRRDCMCRKGCEMCASNPCQCNTDTQKMADVTKSDILSSYIASLKALGVWSQSAHHLTKGEGFSGDHAELYGNLYTALQDMFDASVEKVVGITNDESFGCAEKVAEESLVYLKQQGSAADMSAQAIAETALDMVKRHIALIAWAFDTLEQMGELTLGLNDFLAAQASELETFVYLLQQRIKS
jgi:DNA-binding ferritin-like protein